MNYTVKEHNNCLKISAEVPMQIEDCCYDETRDEFVVAVKYYRGRDYYVDYIVLNRECQIVRKMTETKGVNPRFVLAPDYRFFWNGSFWGYVCDMWSEKKPDKLLQYEFDKKGLFKNRKTWKLEGLRNAVPFVQGDALYLCQQNWAEGMVSIYRMTEPEMTELDMESASIGRFTWCHLVKVDAQEYEFLCFEKNEIHRLVIDKAGQVHKQERIHIMDDTCFFSIMDLQVLKDDRVVVSYVCENQCGTIEIEQDNVRDVFKKKNDTLYCRGKEIALGERLAFHIMTDGKQCYHLATNIEASGGKYKCIYVCE